MTRIASVRRICRSVEMSEDADLRRFAIGCLNELSDVQRHEQAGDFRRAEKAILRAERMGSRIEVWPGKRPSDAFA
jgi:hypothetical protein